MICALRLADAFAQRYRCLAMTTQAEGANVVEVAFASAFGDGENVVGVPQAFPCAPLESPVGEQRSTPGGTGIAELAGGCDGINPATGADATVALEDLLTEIRGLGAQLPLVDTILRAESEAAARDFERTPAAIAATIGTAGH